MSEEERLALLKRIETSTEEAKVMTKEEARDRLKRDGFFEQRDQFNAALRSKAS